MYLIGISYKVSKYVTRGSFSVIFFEDEYIFMVRSKMAALISFANHSTLFEDSTVVTLWLGEFGLSLHFVVRCP